MMLTGAFANTLNLLSIAVLAFAVTSIVLSVAWFFVRPLLYKVTPTVQKTVLWTWVVIPWFTAMLSILAFMPSISGAITTSKLFVLAHWHHEDYFDLESWHGIALFTFSFLILYALLKKVFSFWTQSLSVRKLLSLSSHTNHANNHGHNFVVIDSNIPAAFTTGIVRPECYLTSGLISKLSSKEQDIVIQHELGHIERKDTLFKAMFSVFSAFYFLPVSKQLYSTYCLATETQADISACHYHHRLDVAQTLVKVSKIQRDFPFLKADLLISNFGQTQIIYRVERLLEKEQEKAFPTFRFFFVVIVFTLFSISSMDGLHHLFELFFAH
ncbi:MAG: M56 family metallopeptidase [Hydrogenovibrio sp.]